MPRAVPLCLLQLIGDCAAQALDEARDVSDEFEAECRELAGRVSRIESVLRVIRECAHESTAPVPSTDSAACDMTRIALHGLGKMSAELTGVPVDVFPSPGKADSSDKGNSDSCGLLLIGRPVSLAEATLDLLAANTKTVFRRATTRKRERDEMSEADRRTTVFGRLSVSQRRRRLALYSARVPLFPRLVLFPTEDIKNPNSTVPFVSPAVRDFAALNVEAECEMLADFLCVDTKAQLLREVPALRGSVELMESALQPIGSGAKPSGPPWFEFPSCALGVVRIVVRRSLVMDIVWDSVREGRWRVLDFHWILRAQPPPDFLRSTSSASSSSSSSSSKAIAARRVLPAHREAALRFLSNAFATGLECGCVAALRLVSAVAMEVVETQCRALREKFFIGPMESSLTMDVRPGTHVALSVQLPSPTSQATDKCVFLKYTLATGSVLVETRKGRDTGSTKSFDMFTEAFGDAKAMSDTSVNPLGIIIDTERILWKLVSD